MIRRKTLLVLGAGASRPYGLPLGSELTDTLCRWAWVPPPENAEPVKLIVECGGTVRELVQFCRAFHRSLLPSVDAFLTHRQDMAEVGKLAIAYVLPAMERPEDEQWFIGEDHWYRHLWNRLREECGGAQDILNNQLRVITFNYDRSLEYALYRAIRYTFNVDVHAGQRVLDSLKVQHVGRVLHGRAGCGRRTNRAPGVP